MIFTTKRLIVRRAQNRKKDVKLYYLLWNNPEVMKFVGFPNGLQMTKMEIQNKLSQQKKSEFDTNLIIELLKTGEFIGEAKLGKPDENKIASTDVKILPKFYGNSYGKEIKKGLVDYIFTHTDAVAIQTSPNVKNVASIRMQEYVGAKRVGEEVYHFPENMQKNTIDVHYYIYKVFRKDWEKK